MIDGRLHPLFDGEVQFTFFLIKRALLTHHVRLNLGGAKLYGNDATVPLRELIQNAADAVQARRKFQKRPSDWGLINVGLLPEGDRVWLVVEDNGIGMSEQVLTGPLLDFGTSFWRSPLAMEEFPGLMSAGMHAIGRFGIGFFSVFTLGPVVRVYSRRCDKGQETGRLLEFRGGTSSRPILSPVRGEPVPIDGGTRVEVLLKNHPHETGGLLHIPYTKRTMSLNALVGAIAPNLDVAIATMAQGGVQPVARPGDWLKISDFDLVRRLNPAAERSEADAPRADRTLMQPIRGPDGQVFGRAFISPSRYSYSADGGWVTISGLRAARLHNMEGVLLGEAVTAARGAAQPIAKKEALAQWASKQAKLIAASVKDEERQARSAEVVLECGGDVGALKFIKWRADWLDGDELEDRLRSSGELVISFRGEFDYDEDQDDVHPKDFRESFRLSDEIALVLRHDGAILKGNSSWPRSITGEPKPSESNVADAVRKIIHRVWGSDIVEEDEERVVGKVGYSEIIRSLTVFRANEEEPL
jgi:Histidine kinase-, DNA gyrase B-, and HSP90-like ATPase